MGKKFGKWLGWFLLGGAVWAIYKLIAGKGSGGQGGPANAGSAAANGADKLLAEYAIPDDIYLTLSKQQELTGTQYQTLGAINPPLAVSVAMEAAYGVKNSSGKGALGPGSVTYQYIKANGYPGWGDYESSNSSRAVAHWKVWGRPYVYNVPALKQYYSSPVPGYGIKKDVIVDP